MNPLLLALFGIGGVVALTTRPKTASEGAGDLSDENLPAGYTVVCPTRLEHLPEHAPAQTAYGNWTQPCEVQSVANVPPTPFYGDCGPQGCFVLPDGTPLYEYMPDGTTSASVSEEFAAGTRTGVFVGPTWFAGVPLNYPPQRPNGTPFYGTTGAGIGVGAPWGAAALDISSSPAPYAWRDSTALLQGTVRESDLTAIDTILGQLPARTYTPVNPSILPQAQKRAFAPDLNEFVNNLGKYACKALSTGLKIATKLEPTGIGKSLSAGIKKNESTINYFTKLCGGK